MQRLEARWIDKKTGEVTYEYVDYVNAPEHVIQ